MISEKLDLDKEELKKTVSRQFRYLDTFSLYVRYLIEDKCENVMNVVEEEALK